MTSHRFGGQWTEEKLDRLKDYLSAYTKIFDRNERARYFQTTFVDAFAGTGYRTVEGDDGQESPSSLLQDVYDDEEAEAFQKGSARIAVETEPSFDNYLFIEENPNYAQALEQLRDQFPHKAHTITIVQGEANEELRNWCRETDWSRNRAVVFLDPYGMEVEWTTIEAIASTQAIDLWILFPLGQAVNRLLTRNKLPEGKWAERLTILFGTEAWKDAFYQPRRQMSWLDSDDTVEKDTNFEKIGEYFLERLGTIFDRVADNPLSLRNSRNVPIYLLCFAAGNPKGASTAVKIAQDILGRLNR